MMRRLSNHLISQLVSGLISGLIDCTAMTLLVLTGAGFTWMIWS